MKKIFLYSLMFVTVCFYSCEDKVGVPDPGQYTTVYMPRAYNSPVVTPLFLADTTYTFPYSAYLGGTLSAQKNIQVSFGVDAAAVDSFNLENGTNYKLMPEGSYTIGTPEGVISAGQRSTDSLTLTVTPSAKSGLALFQTYVLPLAITKIDGINGKISRAFGVTYFIFSVSYAPGKVPRDKVLSVGANWGNIFCNGPKGTLILRDPSNNDLMLYMPDADGNFTIPPLDFGQNWGASASFYYVNETSMVVENIPPYAGLFNFILHPENIMPDNLTPDDIVSNAPNFWLGDHWDVYQFAPYNNLFMTVSSDGQMWSQPAYSFNTRAGGVQVGSGFTNYKHFMEYPSLNANSMLGIDNNGDMWLFPMSEDGVPGAERQVGSGWDMYVKVVASGNDLLAIDDKGDVYRYKFNPDGFYPLK